MASKKVKPKLSNSILDMKFMQLKQTVSEAERNNQKNSTSDSQLPSGSVKFVYETSFMKCENYIDGRFSCGGMNPELEKILAQEAAEKESKRKEAAEEARKKQAKKLAHMAKQQQKESKQKLNSERTTETNNQENKSADNYDAKKYFENVEKSHQRKTLSYNKETKKFNFGIEKILETEGEKKSYKQKGNADEKDKKKSASKSKSSKAKTDEKN